jgi:hypothetical protein
VKTRVAATLGILGLVGAVLARGPGNLARARAGGPIRWQSGFGVLETGAHMEQLARAVGRHLVAEPDGHPLLYSFPNDAWLYLALPARNATRFDILIPGLFPRPYVDEVLSDLRARRPGTVVYLSVIPADDIRRTVEANYVLAEDTGVYRIYVRGESPP